MYTVPRADFNSRPCARGDSNSAQKCTVDYVQKAETQLVIWLKVNCNKRFKQIICTNIYRNCNSATDLLRRPNWKLCFAAIGAKSVL